MAETVFKHGNPLMVDYTPGSAVAAGEVVIAGDVCYICHTAIAANELGALAAGGGVYEATSDGTVDLPGVPVYWDEAANKITTAAAGEARIGYSLPGQGATVDDDKIRFIHQLDDAA